jgi:hypothetical protein
MLGLAQAGVAIADCEIDGEAVDQIGRLHAARAADRRDQGDYAPPGLVPRVTGNPIRTIPILASDLLSARVHPGLCRSSSSALWSTVDGAAQGGQPFAVE